jgi:ketosteroid isomerase-like protein
MRHRAGIMLCVALLGAGSAAGAQSAGADERAIRDARERSNLAIAAHDTAALAAEWMETLIVVTSNGAQQVGRAVNVVGFADLFSTRPNIVYRRTPDRISVFDPWGMAGESGRWVGSWTAEDGVVRIGGTYFAKWQRVGERWRIQAEIYVPESCEGGAYCRTMPITR